MANVSLVDIEKRFGAHVVIPSLSLEIADGSFVVLVGPSGCGKTTTLNMIAGLETITAGQLLVGGRDVTDMPPKDRDIAMVFQSYALFPHMTVFDNTAFGMKIRRLAKSEIDTQVHSVADRLRGSLLDRLPKALSGGPASASRSLAHWSAGRGSFSWTSRCRISMRSFASRRAASLRRCTTKSA
jgi:multiple sugar transport system ATP-binding protein